MYIRFIIIIFLSSTSTIYSQKIKPITLTDSEIIIRNGSSESIYFGLAAGDKIKFEMDCSKRMKDFEFREYPSTTIHRIAYLDTNTINTIEIEHDGIYYFYIHHAGFLASKRNCHLKVIRTPQNAQTAKFNTNVYWKTQIDTVWYIEKEKYLAQKDTIVTSIINQTLQLGKGKSKDNKKVLSFSLPDSCTKWSYWISTEKDAEKNFSQSEKNLSPNLRKHGLMASVALNGNLSFISSSNCQEILLYSLDNSSLSTFNSNAVDTLKSYKSICFDFASNTKKEQEKVYFLGFYNKNKKKVNLSVKIVSVFIKETWAWKDVKKYKIEATEVPYLKN
ncbi:MAG: hypothetical protein MUC49_16970 [Raineya sp.]|jgi:hypothetical protein|nr:hypothetical protein [Raineya sp.]